MKDSVYEALRFAIDRYEKAGIGQDGNYYFPPAEMLFLLNNMNMGSTRPDVFVAGILFNTIGDTAATLEMIGERFGEGPARLVAELLIRLYLEGEE